MPVTKLKCVFVHGWGMNRHVWQPLIDCLPEWIDPLLVDLPGHGLLAEDSFTTLDDLVESLCQQVNQPAIWIGWSLGGLAVCQLALQRPQQVIAMMQVSSSPCFTYRDDWPVGLDAAVFNQFEMALQTDFSATIQRFLALQMRGSENSRQILRELKLEFSRQAVVNPQALSAGLNILKQSDLREQLSASNKLPAIPVAWVLGKQDTLVKSAVADEVTKLLPQANVSVIEGAAHAPFLSHISEFKQNLQAFLEPLKKMRD